MTGYTLGAGVEYGITENFTAKLEYLFADVGSQHTNLFPGTVDTDLKPNIVRVGLNYKF